MRRGSEGCGVAQRVRRGSLGWGVAQIVARGLAIRQARVRIPGRHPRGGPLPSGKLWGQQEWCSTSSIYKILYVCSINVKINKESGRVPTNLKKKPKKRKLGLFWNRVVHYFVEFADLRFAKIYKKICRFAICGLAYCTWEIYGFAIAEWTQEFADFRFADLQTKFACPPLYLLYSVCTVVHPHTLI